MSARASVRQFDEGGQQPNVPLENLIQIYFRSVPGKTKITKTADVSCRNVPEEQNERNDEETQTTPHEQRNAWW